MSVIDSCFLHFFDIHYLEERTRSFSPEIIANELKHATLFSLLFSKITFIPLASYVESPLCQNVLADFEPLYEFGLIRYIGRGSTIEEYLETKSILYPSNSDLGRMYKLFGEREYHDIPYQEKSQSTTKSIVDEWMSLINNEEFEKALESLNLSVRKMDIMGKKWEDIPKKLDKKAFILSNVIPLLNAEIEHNIHAKNKLHRIINMAYFGHFIRSIQCGVITDMAFLDYPPITELTNSFIPYNYILQTLRASKELSNQFLSFETEAIIKNRTNEDRIKDIFFKATELRSQSISKILQTKGYTMKEKELPLRKIGIVTALPVEFAAMKLMVDEPVEIDIPEHDPNDYAGGIIVSDKGEKITLVIALCKEMGTNNAANTTTHLLRSFPEVQEIIMVGIAGGVPNPDKVDKHVRLGDIVAVNNDGILQYDNLKLENEKIEIRTKSSKPSSKLIGVSRIIESEILIGKKPWIELIEEKRGILENSDRPPKEKDILLMNGEEFEHPEDSKRESGKPKVFFGRIGSSNTLLKNEKLRNILRDDHDVRAIEMEGAGISDGTWTVSKDYFVIRGIVDYCNPSKGDAWHSYGALIAAAFTKHVIKLIK